MSKFKTTFAVLALASLPVLTACTGAAEAGTAHASTPKSSLSKPAAPKPTPKPSPAPAVYNCKSQIPRVVKLSANLAPKQGRPSIIQIYKPRLVKDVQAEYAAGAVKMPRGKVQMKVLVCEGLAAASDNHTYPVSYGVTVDLNDELFDYYQAH